MTKQPQTVTQTQTISKETVETANHNAGQKLKKRHTLLSKKVWAAFMTVFISGIAIGAMTMHIFIYNKLKRHAPPPERIKMRLLLQMTRELNLSPKQISNAEKILTSMATQLTMIKETQAPKVNAIIQSAFANIEKLLNEEQKRQFLEMQKRVRSCRKRRGGSCQGVRGCDVRERNFEGKPMIRHKPQHHKK